MLHCRVAVCRWVRYIEEVWAFGSATLPDLCESGRRDVGEVMKRRLLQRIVIDVLRIGRREDLLRCSVTCC